MSPTPAEARVTAMRLAAFAALAALATSQWFSLVSDPPLGRAALLVLAVTAGAAALAAAGVLLRTRERRPRLLGLGLAVAAAAATIVAALAITGVPGHLLAPWRWDNLLSEIDPAMTRFDEIGVPYDGGDPWLRLAILLGAPVLLASAAILAFWPARRQRPVLDALGLAALLLLFGVAVSWDSRHGELALGLVLLLLTAAWIWGPGLARARGRGLAAGALIVGLAAAAALPLAARLDPEEPLWDYKSWDVFGERAIPAFQWSHSYGPLDWPRDGTVLMEVKADRPLYWKAEVLDEFDGFRWTRSPVLVPGSPALSPFALRLQTTSESHPEWREVAGFELRDMRSEFLLGPGTIESIEPGQGTIESIEGVEGLVPGADGTTPAGGRPLGPGDRWAVISYVPDPAPPEMAAAGPYGPEVSPYTTFTVPAGDGRFIGSPVDGESTVTIRPWGATVGGTPNGGAVVAASPYSEMLRLSRRLTAEAPNAYLATLAVQSYLERSFEYFEAVPTRPYPLPAFLFEDRIGYCQQFSGAMALLLRMSGIPARVAAGFAPGASRDDRFEVTDFDAHSWVEVYFPGIGWVTFDPTPRAAPPQLQPSTQLGLAGATGGIQGRGGGPSPNAERSETAGAGAPSSGGGSAAGALVAAIAAGTALVGAGFAMVALRRRRRLVSGAAIGDQLAEIGTAFPRLGWRVVPGSTLLKLERRLASSSRSDAAAYVAALRRHLYAPGGEDPPGPRQRRAFRRGLTAARGMPARLRGWRAIPPGGPRRAGGG